MRDEFCDLQKLSEERLREEVLRETTILVEKMFTIDTLGTPLVSKQIIELQLSQGTIIIHKINVCQTHKFAYNVQL